MISPVGHFEVRGGLLNTLFHGGMVGFVASSQEGLWKFCGLDQPTGKGPPGPHLFSPPRAVKRYSDDAKIKRDRPQQ
ncbi:uncharacterized protein LOC135131081 isoform X2 [Zophobas morio]|uniref:uncharacterized protein LOC135131081 isoform X2 n=1 Tax=Zophobas morio TaxID=2755281 RepID=UPI003083D476